MKTSKKELTPIMTAEQIVQKKQDAVNPFVAKIDWAKLAERKS